MKTKILKMIAKARQCFLPMLLVAVLGGSCSDDDAVQTPLGAPHVTNSYATVSSLTFTWDKVEGVSSYSCELKDTYGETVDGTVTVSTTAAFTGLQPNTEYTLEVYAYAAIGSGNTTSQVATLKATTAAVVTLKMGELTVEVKGTTAVLSWEEVEHAESYAYTYMADGKEVVGTTEEPRLTLRQLPQGDYRVSVSAVPAEDDEAHAASPAASVTFTIAQEKTALWMATGTYTSALGASWKAVLIAWNDDSYTLSGWYGVEGYDLTFTVNKSGEMELTDYEEDGGYFYVPTGLSGNEGIWIYLSSGNSSFEGDSKEGGNLWFYADDGYDQFVWEAVSSSMSIDNLVGSYLETASGIDYYIYNWGAANSSFSYDDNNEVSIEQGEGNTVVLRGFYWTSESLVGAVDLDAHTITFAPGQVFAQYYTFAAETGADAPVVATFDENCTIHFEGWSAWYSGSAYVEKAVSTLVKQ